MIFVNPNSINPGSDWLKQAKDLTAELMRLPERERSDFINQNRDATWGNPILLAALREPLGNKCWYSEVPLEGADPNVDHFRPKGPVHEVDLDFHSKHIISPGYWWLAFELRNFRLASMHSNQRRVDENTDGGKWNYFPVRGPRAPEGTEWDSICEDVMPLDPCSASDLKLLWFDLDGVPCTAARLNKVATDSDKRRVAASIWLYHLNKVDIQARRTKHVEEVRKDLRNADVHFKLWNQSSDLYSLREKNHFDARVADIKTKISDKAEFAGAKRCVVRLSIIDYPWIEEYGII